MLKKNFKINSNLYENTFILQAISDFDGYDIIFNDGDLIISGENEDDINEIFNEFMNYVVALYNESL